MVSYHFYVVLLASTLYGTLAQYGAPTSSGSTTRTTTAAATASASNIHQVAVGKNGLVYTPDTLQAAPGDTVEFTFAAGHSVTLSTFSNPCQAVNTSAIFSGFPPTTEMFTLKINDTNPLWLFCSQVSHCQSGMAMVINPPSGGNTLAAYKAAAANSGSSTTPAGVEGGLLLPVGAAIASSSSGAAATSTTTPASTPSSTKSSAANNLVDNMRWAVVSVALVGWLFRL